jgi:hypothetical protein
MLQTTKKRLTPHTRGPEVDPLGRAQWVKLDGIGNRLSDIASELSVIYWACAGLRETISGGNQLSGIEHLADRLQRELEAIAEEVRT